MPLTTVTMCTEDIEPALALAAAAVPKRSTREHLTNVRLTADHADQAVTLVGTDLEMMVQAVTDAEVDGPRIDLLLPAHRLLAVLRAGGAEEVAIAAGDGPAAVTVGNATATIYPDPADGHPEWPSPHTPAEDAVATLSPERLSRVLEATAPAVALAAVQYAMTGINLALSKATLEAAGTDSHRLAVASMATESCSGPDRSGIMLARGAGMVRCLCEEARDDVRLALGERRAEFAATTAWGHARAWVSLIQGRYPRYRDIYPSLEGSSTIAIPRGELTQALRLAAPFASKDDHAVRLSCNGTAWTMLASGGDGDAAVALPGAAPHPLATVVTNHQYLAQAVALADGDTIHLRMTPQQGGVVDTPVVIESDHIHVMMPLSRPRRMRWYMPDEGETAEDGNCGRGEEEGEG